eukprot:1348463-Ditylum_brightwellii.AAC.1
MAAVLFCRLLCDSLFSPSFFYTPFKAVVDAAVVMSCGVVKNPLAVVAELAVVAVAGGAGG